MLKFILPFLMLALNVSALEVSIFDLKGNQRSKTDLVGSKLQVEVLDEFVYLVGLTSEGNEVTRTEISNAKVLISDSPSLPVIQNLKEPGVGNLSDILPSELPLDTISELIFEYTRTGKINSSKFYSVLPSVRRIASTMNPSRFTTLLGNLATMHRNKVWKVREAEVIEPSPDTKQRISFSTNTGPVIIKPTGITDFNFVNPKYNKIDRFVEKYGGVRQLVLTVNNIDVPKKGERFVTWHTNGSHRYHVMAFDKDKRLMGQEKTSHGASEKILKSAYKYAPKNSKITWLMVYGVNKKGKFTGRSSLVKVNDD